MSNIVEALEYDRGERSFKCEPPCNRFLGMPTSTLLIEGRGVNYFRCPEGHNWAHDTVSGRWLRNGVELRG